MPQLGQNKARSSQYRINEAALTKMPQLESLSYRTKGEKAFLISQKSWNAHGSRRKTGAAFTQHPRRARQSWQAGNFTPPHSESCASFFLVQSISSFDFSV